MVMCGVWPNLPELRWVGKRLKRMRVDPDLDPDPDFRDVGRELFFSSEDANKLSLGSLGTFSVNHNTLN